ncbi:MAG: tetratricopeptide repeat protein [Methylobacter sp.]|jgi:tetratricopeptide (TPR) repeat protein
MKTKIDLSAKKILIIEDRAIMRETIKHILVDLGARFFVEAESGVNAMAAMRKEKFDIVLCDYNLGEGKNGQQILEEAKYLKLLPLNAIFIMVTGEQHQSVILSILDHKLDDFLIKPFNRQQLLGRLERCYVIKEYLADIDREIDNGNLYQAINNCEKLLEQDNKKMRLQLLKTRAELAIKISDFKTAAKIYQEILKEREIPWARLGLGIIAFSNDNFTQAIVSFQQVINETPTMLEAYDWLAKSHEALGDHEEALSTINSAIELCPLTILRQKRLALLADKTDNVPVAKKAYGAAVQLGKHSIHKSPEDYAGLAKAHLKTNSTNEALKTLLDLSQQFHNDPEGKLRAATLEIDIYKKIDKEGLAKQSYDKAIKLNAQFGNQASRGLRLEMAKACHLYGDTQISEEILADLVKTNIDDKQFIDTVGEMCTTFIGDNYAEILLRQVKQELIDVNNKGVSLFKEGKIDEALAVFEEAIEKMPDNQTIILNMAKIMVHDIKTSGGTQEKILNAQAYINKAIQLGIPHNKIGGLQAELDKANQ